MSNAQKVSALIEEIRELNLAGADESGHRWANSNLINETCVKALNALRAAPTPDAHSEVGVKASSWPVLEALAEGVVQDVCEWDDRTSPEGYEEYMILTPVEFRNQLMGFAKQVSKLVPVNVELVPPAWMLEPAAIYLEMVDDDETGSNIVVAKYLRSLVATPAGVVKAEPVAVTDEMVERALEAFNVTINEPKMVPCDRCDGKGYHHGFGEDGSSPDWCEKCGGNQFDVVPGEEARAMRAALYAALASKPEGER